MVLSVKKGLFRLSTSALLITQGSTVDRTMLWGLQTCG